MQVFDTKNIRNVAFVSHGGAGKTTLLDAAAYLTKQNDRAGRPENGTSFLDNLPEEIDKKITITSKILACPYQNTKLNLIDTPGYADFYGEVISSLAAAEAAVMVLCGVNGVEVQTEKVYRDLESKNTPLAVFVNKMDKERANFDAVLESLSGFKANFVPFQIPIGAAESFKGFVDVLTKKAYDYKENGEAAEIEMPSDLKAKVDGYYVKIVEAAAETDEKLMEKYFEEGTLSDDEIAKGIVNGIKNKVFLPVLCGAAGKNQGVKQLLDFLVKYIPSPAEFGFRAVDKNTQEEKELPISENGPVVAFVYKTVIEQHVGELNFVKVYSGKLTSGLDLINVSNGSKERVGQMLIMNGKNKIELKEVKAGDTCALVKLKAVSINDTLSSGSLYVNKIEFPKPVMSVAVVPQSKKDQEKLSGGLQAFMKEDLTFKMEIRKEFSETVVSGMGDQHIDLKIKKLQNKYGVKVDLVKPRIPYRETIKKSTKAEHKYKKQSGGRGQYGHCYIELHPYSEAEFDFADKIVGGAIPGKYIPAVEKGIKDAMSKGYLAGYPIINVQAVLYDGTFHNVDSSDLAFQIAGSMAFQKGMETASPVLLEPVMNVEITVESNFTGDVISDLNSRRGKVMGMDPQGNFQVIKALVPDAELYKYATDLRSLTQGKGMFSKTFHKYEPVPNEIAQKIIAESKKEEEEN